MNLNLAEIRPFCTTEKQQKCLEKLQKKFAITSAANRATLADLLGSLFLNEHHTPLLTLLPGFLNIPAGEIAKVWAEMADMLAILALLPALTQAQRKAIFDYCKSVTEYKSQRKTPITWEDYFPRILSLSDLKWFENNIKLGIKEQQPAFEYTMRLDLLKYASQARLVNEFLDFKALRFPAHHKKPKVESREALQLRMNEIIAEQLQALKEPRLLQYS